MEIRFLYPQLETLKSYVDYYYIFNPAKIKLDEFYLAYPMSIPLCLSLITRTSQYKKAIYITGSRKLPPSA